LLFDVGILLIQSRADFNIHALYAFNGHELGFGFIRDKRRSNLLKAGSSGLSGAKRPAPNEICALFQFCIGLLDLEDDERRL